MSEGLHGLWKPLQWCDMGKLREPEPALLFVGVLAQKAGPVDQALARLSEAWGEVGLSAGPMEFSRFTSYYREEMGDALFRWFFSFKRLVDPAFLVPAKHEALAVEGEFSQEGRRRINLDPGLVQLSKVVLSTTKDHAHRVYLGKGVFAEVTLSFIHRRWQAQPWTYPDYRTDEYQSAFSEMRQRLAQEITPRCTS